MERIVGVVGLVGYIPLISHTWELTWYISSNPTNPTIYMANRITFSRVAHGKTCKPNN